MPDYKIRVENKRIPYHKWYQIGDHIIHIDRSNPILGNPFILHNKNDDIEREEVIDNYQRILYRDFSQKGPMYMECEKISQLIKDGESIVLLCWCHPKPCHGDVLIKKILEMI